MKFTNTAWFHTVVIGLIALVSVLMANVITEIFGIKDKILEYILLFLFNTPMVLIYYHTRIKKLM